MDLVQGRSARQRNDFVLRLGCWMVTLSMVFSLVIQPPKAKAIVAEASLATSVIWAFMQSAGITFNGIKDCWVGSACPGCSLVHDNNLAELLIEICPDCPERLSASCGTCLDHNTPFCACWQRVTT